MNNSPGIKMKFCEALDRFVAIRTFTAQQCKELLQNAQIKDQKTYRRLIITSAVVNYLDEIAPMIGGKEESPMLEDIVELELYNLCIKVNPGLDIREVTISVADQEAGGQIPLLESGPQTIMPPESARLLKLEEEVRRRIIGQDEAVKTVCHAIRKSKVGLGSPRRPVGSFLFVGATGVGKTELAKALAACLHGSESHMVRVDCSEYAMSHEYAKLIGAPPGYIGHNDGGILTEAMKSRPNTVVMFDEVEKAHRKVHNILLQIMDEGMLTDSKGALVSFKDAVVVMTSNIGVESLDRLGSAIGFDGARPRITHDTRVTETRKALEKFFAPEFLNRIDEVVVFRTLNRDDNVLIAGLLLAEVSQRLSNLGVTIEFSAASREFIVSKGTDEKYGARPLRRAIQRYVENPLAERILGGQLQRGEKLSAGVTPDGDGLVFDTVHA